MRHTYFVVSFSYMKVSNYLIGAASDHVYCPDRCLGESSTESLEKERTIVQMASLVATWTTPHYASLKLWDQFEKWEEFAIRVTQTSFDSPDAWFSISPSEAWFTLLSLCLSASKEKDMYGLMFALGCISYRSDFDIHLVDSLCALATSSPSDPLRKAASLLLDDLTDQCFDLVHGYTLDIAEVQRIARQHCIPFESSPQKQPLHLSSSATDPGLSNYQSECTRQCRLLAKYIINQWPDYFEIDQWPDSLSMPSDFASVYSLILPLFEQEIVKYFTTRSVNYRLHHHTQSLQSALDIVPGRLPVMEASTPAMPPETQALTPPPSPSPRSTPLTLLDLVRSDDRLTSAYLCPQIIVASGSRQTSSTSSTRELIRRLSKLDSGGISARYAGDLRRCVDALETTSKPFYEHIRNALRPQTAPEEVLFFAGLWPTRGPQSLLSLLSLHLRQHVHNSWQKVIVRYAEGLADTQRTRRIALFEHLGLQTERLREKANNGGQGWNTVEYPDWLLIQLDADLLIRPVQASIAQEMMYPRSQQNTTMQLNMGEGKSSVSVIGHIQSC
jgi:Protein of unknown function (DUF3638)